MLKLTALLSVLGYIAVVLAGAVLSFILAISCFQESEYAYAFGFTLVLLVVPVAWLAGVTWMVLAVVKSIELGFNGPRNKDEVEMVSVPGKCPTCGHKDLMAISLGRDLGMVCCTRKLCDDFGKAINLNPAVEVS